MKFAAPTLSAALVLALVLALCACVHTPPGTSVEVALAKKAELYRRPAPPKPTLAVAHEKKPTPKPKRELPSSNQRELAEKAFARGQSCMKDGKDAEAIEAFEETVKLDPNFRDAWQWLAILYEKTGQEKKAIEAFRKSKQVVRG